MQTTLPPGLRYPGVLTLYLTQRHNKAFLESASRRYPFGGGVRHCLGRSLATFEMKHILTALVERFRSTPGKKGAEGTRRRGVPWMPTDGAQMVLEEHHRNEAPFAPGSARIAR